MAGRKLLELDPSYSDPLCQVHCGDQNKSGFCPKPCFSICPSNCYKTLPGVESSPPLLSPDEFEDHDPPPVKHHTDHTKLLVIVLAVVSVFVFFLACYSVYKFCSRRLNLRRRRSLLVQEQQPGRDEFLDEEQGPNQAVEHHIWYIRTIGLDPAVISKISVVKFKKGEGLIEGTECSVCLSEFEENETLRLLPKCNHAFHIPCIDTWLTAHTNCPLCRAGVVSNPAVLPSDERVAHDSDVGSVEEEIIRAEISVGVDEVVEASRQVVVGVEDDHEVDSTAQVAVRRSVSMDAISASRLALAVNNARVAQSDNDDQAGEVKELDDGAVVAKSNIGINQRLLRLVGGLSIDRPACIKRSVSCNANV